MTKEVVDESVNQYVNCWQFDALGGKVPAGKIGRKSQNPGNRVTENRGSIKGFKIEKAAGAGKMASARK
jgi:hypothetical protein